MTHTNRMYEYAKISLKRVFIHRDIKEKTKKTRKNIQKYDNDIKKRRRRRKKRESKKLKSNF